MNEPDIFVALAWLAAFAGGLLMPAPLIAYSAQRGARTLWLTAGVITLVLVSLVLLASPDPSQMNPGDKKVVGSVAFLVMVSVGAAGLGASRRRRSRGGSSFSSILIAAISSQLAALVVGGALLLL